MKNLLLSIALFLASFSALAQIGVQYDMAYKQFASTFTFMDFVVHMPASGQCVSMLNADLTAKSPICANMGSGLSFDASTSTLNVSTGPAQVNSDWIASSGVAKILNKPTLATVATSGAYADLTGSPTIPPATTLTTTGTGSATYNGGTGVLNIPTPPAQTAFNYGSPAAKTVAVSTTYQAADNSKAAVVTVSPSCQNATTVLASSACTLQVRQSASSGLTCGNGTVASTWTSTVQLGLAFTGTSGSPFDVKLPIGGYFILCSTAGTFTLSAVEQVAG